MEAKTNKQCILFARCSTKQQDTDGQLAKIEQTARRFGYQDSNFIYVVEYESGYKLSEDERAGLRKLKKIIESNTNVECVFVTEVSRIGRRRRLLFDILDWFVDNKLQLYIWERDVFLLNEDGSLSDRGYDIFYQEVKKAEDEIQVKVRRSNYGKERCHVNHFWDGAMLPLGYIAEDKRRDKRVLVDKDNEYKIVRKIYELYLSDHHSTTSIAKELDELGMVDNKQRKITQSRVAAVLSKRRYIGDEVYPSIITEEEFNKAAQIRANAKQTKKNSNLSEALCSKLIRCPECGYNFTNTGKIYRCFRNHFHQCSNSVEINMNTLDKIVWSYAADIELSEMLSNLSSEKEKIEEDIEVEKKKLSKLNKTAEHLPVKLSNLLDALTDGLISKEEYKRKKESVQADKARLVASIDAQQESIEFLMKKLSTLNSERITREKIDELNMMMPAQTRERRRIVRKHIKSVEFGEYKTVPVECSTSVFTSVIKQKKCLDITICDNYGFGRVFRWFPRFGFGSSKLIELPSELNWQ